VVLSPILAFEKATHKKYSVILCCVSAVATSAGPACVAAPAACDDALWPVAAVVVVAASLPASSGVAAGVVVVFVVSAVAALNRKLSKQAVSRSATLWFAHHCFWLSNDDFDLSGHSLETTAQTSNHRSFQQFIPSLHDKSSCCGVLPELDTNNVTTSIRALVIQIFKSSWQKNHPSCDNRIQNSQQASKIMIECAAKRRRQHIDVTFRPHRMCSIASTNQNLRVLRRVLLFHENANFARCE
jgi:hypothetical protein